MLRAIPTRSWATPLTIGSFILMTATGILMFFEWERGLMAVVHQWFSWLFVIGAGGHIAVNVRPFTKHLKSSWGKVSVAAFTAVLALSYFSWGMITGPQLQRPIEQALVDAPVSALAGVTRSDADELIRRLHAHGIVGESHESIGELADRSGVGENRLLAIVFSLD
jgi:hypothetical protein